ALSCRARRAGCRRRLPRTCRAIRLDGCFGGGDEPKLRHVPELADVERHLEEGVEPGTLAWSEAVAELREVAGEEAGRVAVALGRLACQVLRLRACEPDGCDERVLELRQARRPGIADGPDGEHHRQARPLEPEPAEVVV